MNKGGGRGEQDFLGCTGERSTDTRNTKRASLAITTRTHASTARGGSAPCLRIPHPTPPFADNVFRFGAAVQAVETVEAVALARLVVTDTAPRAVYVTEIPARPAVDIFAVCFVLVCQRIVTRRTVTTAAVRTEVLGFLGLAIPQSNGPARVTHATVDLVLVPRF